MTKDQLEYLKNVVKYVRLYRRRWMIDGSEEVFVRLPDIGNVTLLKAWFSALEDFDKTRIEFVSIDQVNAERCSDSPHPARWWTRLNTTNASR